MFSSYELCTTQTYKWPCSLNNKLQAVLEACVANHLPTVRAIFVVIAVEIHHEAVAAEQRARVCMRVQLHLLFILLFNYSLVLEERLI